MSWILLGLLIFWYFSLHARPDAHCNNDQVAAHSVTSAGTCTTDLDGNECVHPWHSRPIYMSHVIWLHCPGEGWAGGRAWCISHGGLQGRQRYYARWGVWAYPWRIFHLTAWRMIWLGCSWCCCCCIPHPALLTFAVLHTVVSLWCDAILIASPVGPNNAMRAAQPAPVIQTAMHSAWAIQAVDDTWISL